MVIWDLKLILIYLAVLSFLAVLILLFRSKLSSRFGLISFLILSIIIVGYNLVSFPSFIQNNEWGLERLPSDEYLDLIENSYSLTRSSWIYPLIEDNYQGRTLLIPENVLESLELSLDRLEVQGRLDDVRVVPNVGNVTERDLERILSLEHINFVNEKTNLSYYFVQEGMDPGGSLLLLKFENEYIFIPEDLLPEGKENQ